MTTYSLALFLHIVGALGMFPPFGLEGVALMNVRRAATAEQFRQWASVFGLLRRLGPASLGLLLLAGLYMAATAWGPQAWITTAFLTLILIALMGARNGLRLAAIGRRLATPQGPLTV